VTPRLAADSFRPVSAGRSAFYRLPVDAPESAREAAARAGAEQRLRRQRETLRPLGLVVIAAVVIGAVNGHPAPARHGEGLGVVVALVAFAASLAFAVQGSFIGRAVPVQVAVIAAIGAAGITLLALQPRGSAELAVGAAVWMAVARLPLRVGVGLATATTAGLALVEVLGHGSAAVVLAGVLLCGLLGLVAYFLKKGRESQARTELLLAQLEDAREEQLRAAAVSERGRIASELHDVLAHSLSGAAIQLQGARKLAQREHAGSQVQDAIERAGELVREGLVSARQAVGALRGDDLPGVAELESLVTRFRDDMQTEVSYLVEGDVRPLPAEASLTLYRGAQEALTNVARYAPGATTTVVLRYEIGVAVLTVEDRLDPSSSTAAGLAGVGGGNGLNGLRERLEHAGGRMQAGPTATGWRVELEVPA
jgi:signal transduction histidine kinase